MPHCDIGLSRSFGGGDMKLTKFVAADGSFDYKKYCAIQEEGNKRKLDMVWVNKDLVAYLSKLLESNIGEIKFGLCHGTRRGKEQEWFRSNLNAEVIGTEISSTATEFPNTIQWDFHETKPEWLNATDFIYSNSWDHSYDPEKMFTSWMSCLRPGGWIMLEYTRQHWPDHSNELDPFGISIDELTYLLTRLGGGEYYVRTIIDKFPFEPPQHLKRASMVIIERARQPLEGVAA